MLNKCLYIAIKEKKRLESWPAKSGFRKHNSGNRVGIKPFRKTYERKDSF